MKLSIIIPAYNVQDYILDCLGSLNEVVNRPDVEIIVINDGATDNTKDLIVNHSNNINNLVLLNTTNQGLSSARNKGIEYSTGEYLMFLDSDDFVHESFFQLIYNVREFLDSKADVLCFNFSIYRNGRIEKVIKVDKNSLKLSPKERIFKQNSWYCWRYIFKRNMFENIKFDSGRRFEDQLIIPKVIIDSNSISFHDFTIINYRINDFGITKNLIESDLRDSLFGLERYSKLYISSNSDIRILLECLIGNLYLSHVSKCARIFHKNKRHGMTHLFRGRSSIKGVRLTGLKQKIYKHLSLLVFFYLVIKVKDEVRK